MLQLLAYFDPSDFSFETLRRGLVGNSVPHWFRETFGSKARFLRVVEILLDLSLIDNNKAEGSYSMHRVFHDWLCLFEANAPDLELPISAISFSVPFAQTCSWAKEQQQLVLHAIHVLPRLEDFDPVDFFVRFDQLPSAELDLIASLIDDKEPRRTWEMLRFDHPILGISKLLRSCGKTIEGYGLTTRTRSMLECREYREDDFNRKAVVALLDMITMIYKTTAISSTRSMPGLKSLVMSHGPSTFVTSMRCVLSATERRIWRSRRGEMHWQQPASTVEAFSIIQLLWYP